MITPRKGNQRVTCRPSLCGALLRVPQLELARYGGLSLLPIPPQGRSSEDVGNMHTCMFLSLFIDMIHLSRLAEQ